MAILDRLSRLIRANINDLIDQAEDPEKMIDQILRDMQTNITTARAQVASMIAQEKELEADLQETQKLSREWAEKARRAVAAGKDDGDGLRLDGGRARIALLGHCAEELGGKPEGIERRINGRSPFVHGLGRRAPSTGSGRCGLACC